MRRQNARRLRRIRSSIRAVAQQQDIEESGLKWMAEFSQRSPELFEILKNVTSFRAPTETFERKKHSISAAYATQRQLAAAIGVDPLDALRFFDKSAAKDGGGIMPDVHDSPAQRKATLLKDFAAHPPLLAIGRDYRLNCAP